MPTSPEIARQVIAANKRLFDWARSVNMPVIHLLTQYRDVAEIAPITSAPRQTSKTTISLI